ncbi:MAG: phosphoribosyltransferase family protein [Candidatus Hadarchaeales archaeon]
MRKLLLGWEEVDRMSVALAKKIKKNFRPDIIIGVARGGLVPAVRIAHLLGISQFRAIDVKYYVGCRRAKKPVLVEDIGKIKGKVLVVDDVVDTGTSLSFVISHLKKKGAKEVRTAALAHKPHSSMKPDYFIFETDRWIVFPWEK